MSRVEGVDWVSQYCYDDNNELIEKKFGNGLVSKYNYDKAGRLNHFLHLNYDEVIDEYHIKYDMVGNKKNIKKYRKGIGSRNENYVYYYDKLNRLTDVEMNGERESNFLYDVYGNRLSGGYVNKPKKESVSVPAESLEKEKNLKKAAETVGIGVSGYIIYRALRMIPSFLPIIFTIQFRMP